ncbi:MAG: aspartate aminotransferase family protein [Luteibaculaceae bacterium]
MESAINHFQQVLGQTSPFPYGIEVSHAKGVFVFDVHGKRYFDLISGIAVSNLGHGNQHVIDSIKAQLDKHMHVMVYGEYLQSVQTKFAEKLLRFLPESINAVYPVNSGTEANEAALKLVKRATGRTELISFRGAYHGATHGSLSVSGNEVKKQAFRPLLPDVKFLTFNALEDLSKVTHKTAGVIIEPIQGDAGVRIPNLCFMQQLEKRCREVGALLIVDEIQTGFGRTGTMFAFEHFGIKPDIVTLGKALGGGLPMGALAANTELLRQFTFNPMLGHITTFGGHPVICAAALANLEVMEQENLVAQVEEKGKYLERFLTGTKVKEIRRKGLMFAVEMDSFETVNQVVMQCKEKGVISYWFLSTPNAFRLAPPLTITHAELEEAGKIIKSCLS